MARVDVDATVGAYLIGLGENTARRYRCSLGKWLEWLDRNNIGMLMARRMHIEAWGASMRRHGYSPMSIRSDMSAVCRFYAYLYEEGWLPDNPGEHVRLPKAYSHSCGTVLDRGQAMRFLEAARQGTPLEFAFCSLLLLTGARLHEAVNLDVEDWHDGARPYVRFHRKGAWNQDVGVPPLAAEALRKLIGRRKHGPVFRSASGGRITHAFTDNAVRNVAQRAGLEDITAHSLRRTFCTLSREAGVPDHEIMAMGGWHSLQMLDYYDMAAHGRQGKAGRTLQAYLNEE